MRTFYHSFTSRLPSVYEDEVKLVIREITLEGFNAKTTVIRITYLNDVDNVHNNKLQILSNTKGNVYKTVMTYLITEGSTHIKISIEFLPSETEEFMTLAWDIHIVP